MTDSFYHHSNALERAKTSTIFYTSRRCRDAIGERVYGASYPRDFHDEVHLRSRAIELYLMNLELAIRKIADEAGTTIELPTYSLACEDSAREEIKAVYHEFRDRILNAETESDINAIYSEAYSAFAEAAESHPLGCIDLFSGTNKEAIIKYETLHNTRSLTTHVSHLTITELSTSSGLKVRYEAGTEFINPSTILATIVNRTNRALDVHYGDGTTVVILEINDTLQLNKEELPVQVFLRERA